MRRVRRDLQARGAAAELNMTPMIDVVFLLIIFFLVSSHLARRESRLQLALPTASTGAAATDTAPRLTINVEADGSLLVGADPVTADQLVERLRAGLQRHGAGFRLRLRADQGAPYAAVEPVLAACAEAGVDDVGLAVFPGRRGEAPR